MEVNNYMHLCLIFSISTVELSCCLFKAGLTSVKGSMASVISATLQYNKIQYMRRGPLREQHNTIQYNTTQHNTIQYNTIQHNTTQHNTIQYNTTQYNAIKKNTTQYNTTQYNTIQHNTTQHNTIQYNTTQ